MKLVLKENTWLDRNLVNVGWGNGYVVVFQDHPCYNMNYNDIHDKYPSLDVHGGLTFSESLESLLEIDEFAAIEQKSGWVLGFDTCHMCDDLESWPEDAVLKETVRLKEQLLEIQLEHGQDSNS